MTNRSHHNYERLYHTQKWFKTRKAVLRRDRGLCQICLKRGKYTIGNEIDHIKPLIDNEHLDQYDINNLQVLCKSCHIEKTASESRERSKSKKLEQMEKLEV